MKSLLSVASAIIIFSTQSFAQQIRENENINFGWKFYKYADNQIVDTLIYDVRPDLDNNSELRVADARPTDAVNFSSEKFVMKPWILPSCNNFSDTFYIRPEGNPGFDFPFVKADFDDSQWQSVDLPHDWAISSSFLKGVNARVGGGMGRLPVDGTAWYRKKIFVDAQDSSKRIFLNINGAMSYSMVWINGFIAGGWPYGYNSYQIDLTPYIKFGSQNQIAVRVDNPNYSARWYPGAGLYRYVSLVKLNKVHVAYCGTYITCENVSDKSAKVNFRAVVNNSSSKDVDIKAVTEIFFQGKKYASFKKQTVKIKAGFSDTVFTSLVIKNPHLWGPPPTQTPDLYCAVTKIYVNGKPVDDYKTSFGIRDIKFDPDRGILINGELIKIQGVNQHHDLGALGAAFNYRAAERQLEILKAAGCNAIRLAHNPPDPQLLDLTDKLGFLVIDEIFDSWEKKKTAYDFHLIFPQWWQTDVRAFVRRDKNHPSVIMWSFGNEVGEQYTDTLGAAIALKIKKEVNKEDPSRFTTFSMNYAKPDMPLPAVADVIGLNYQGEGIRQDSIFEGTDRIRTAPQYAPFHQKFPDKVIYSSESASALSSRGVYYFPVAKSNNSYCRNGTGGNDSAAQVSSYELYAVDFGSSADKVFAAQDKNPYVAGEFVWNGFDYLGEPTPYYQARSSYTGFIDLAGFPKDRYWLYMSRWRKDYAQAHILPHWNWPGREGQITPVHVFTSGDEGELFVNGVSAGRKKKGVYEYRLRWDNVVYQPGKVVVKTYKNGKFWAADSVETTGKAYKLILESDRKVITADNKDLAFVTVKIVDSLNRIVPLSCNELTFKVEGAGRYVASDNGNAYDYDAFCSTRRNAFNGLASVIIASGTKPGKITLTVSSPGLKQGTIDLAAQ